MTVQLSQLSRDWLYGDNALYIIDLRINDIHVAICIYRYIARDNVPNHISALTIRFCRKLQSRHGRIGDTFISIYT